MYNYFFSKAWMLSLYGDGVTLMRLDYSSKEACLSAGSSYYRDGSTQYKRYDCGYRCSGDNNNLEDGMVCSQICDTYGCR